MTLIIAAANRQHAVVVADRRTTKPDGSPHSEETGKLAIARVDDARVAIAYAGLAEYGGYKTRFWLPETLSKIGREHHSLQAVLEQLKNAIQANTASLRVRPASSAALTILVAGFKYGPEGLPCPTFARISNFERDAIEMGSGESPQRVPLAIRPVTEEFSLVTDESPAGFTVGAGNGLGLTWDRIGDVRDQLSSGASGRAVRARLVHVVRQAAESRASAGLIGQQCSSLILPSDAAITAEMDYHTAVGTRTVHLPASYDLRSPQHGGGVMVWDASITYGDETSPPAIVPAVAGKRKCPCGSSLQYRRCHGQKGRSGGITLG